MSTALQFDPTTSDQATGEIPSLQELLDAIQRFALHARGTTNHCPMALIALAEMHASPERQQEFFAQWQEKYAIFVDADVLPIPRQEWRQYIGLHEQFPALHRCFTHWIEEQGAAAVLTEVLSQIPFAPASGAFHAVIRLAYGLQVAHQGEIAAGLAALVVGHLPLPLPSVQESMSPKAALAQLSQHMAGRTYQGPWITWQLQGVALDADFAQYLAPVHSEDLVAELAELAIRLYWQTKNFTSLHMVTGLHATRILVQHLRQHLPPSMVASVLPQLLGPLWAAFAAAYVALGAPALAPDTVGDATDSIGVAPDWPALLALAVQSNNDHTIKMTYSCWQEAMHYQARNRQVGMADGFDVSGLYLAAVRRMLKI